MIRLIPGRDRPAAVSPQLRVVPAVLSDPALPHPTLPDAPEADPVVPDPALLAAVEADPAGASPDERVRALWAAYRSMPSRLTREHLVLHYHPLVRAVVHRTAGRLPGHVEPADLVQSGVFGLIEAIERYDPDRCPRFESYAAPRIRGAVLDELRAQDWVPRTVRLRAREAARAREQLTVRLRRTATEREVADALHVGPRELRAATATQLVSIERLREGSGGGVIDVVATADATGDPASVAQEQEMWRQLRLAVAQLGERDRLVLRLYYLERRTLAEIGRHLGVTESRICQLHARLVGRLRGTLEELAVG